MNPQTKTMNQLALEISEWRERKGFTTSWSNMSEKLLLVITEVAEATEAYRCNNLTNFNEEIADTIIRLLDICGSCNIDIEREIAKKMKFNEERVYRHGKRF